jgi:hypothetical protein
VPRERAAALGHGGAVRSACRELPYAHGREETPCDEVDLRFSKGRPKFPTMQVRAADRVPELEVGPQSGVDAAEGVNVSAEVLENPSRLMLALAKAEGSTLSKPPPCGTLVIPVYIDLVDHQRRPGRHQRREMRTRLRERIDVVQRDHSDSRIKRAADLKERATLHVSTWLGRGIDCRHLVASGTERGGQLTLSCPDF